MLRSLSHIGRTYRGATKKIKIEFYDVTIKVANL